ncbi:uncharacterized protein LOC116842151 isoform X2 [Odontomachus brunneus]|uniref:uncharacterized protein LOC116842151 isoform X2 n=2 Tax=Odontomachus brunneus TaxID=486640 RepID=UPI0013F23C4B|nr:uncharacterized protein LOC116842151 isoform X2 [Odontomachus brunneus]
MQHEFYTSCIKVNGIPLLPPLMTDSIKEEMKHYRSLAVKVEEKLKARQSVKRTIEDKCVQANIAESTNQSKNITKYSSDSDLSNYNTTSDTNNSDSYSKVTIVEHSPVMQVTDEARDKLDIQSPMSDTQDMQSQISSINCTDSENNDAELVNIKIDQTECIDTMMEASIPNEEVISSESWKPEIPKTLDIVPITLSDLKCEQDHIKPLTMLTKESEQPPKLSRQGSYVLDTPSPMLLAHMHTELTDKNYVPTPTTVNVSQRKQWNITQSKVEWENKQLPAEDTETYEKLEATHESNFQRAESVVSTDSCQTNKSADCTEATIVEEQHISRFDITSNEHNHTPNIDLKDRSTEKSKRDDSVCVLNLVNKLQEAAAIGNSPETRSPCADGKTHYDKMRDMKEHQDPLVRTKSSITSEKLLTVYREIEEMHKKQMMQLIDRQRKEQSLLQAEFQKQQMLLLAEIQKCSVGIPYQASVTPSVTPNAACEIRQQLDVSSPRSVHADVPCNNDKSSSEFRANVIVCPLNYISSKNLYTKHYKSPLYITDTSSATVNLEFTRQINLREAVHNDSISSNNNSNNNVNDENDDKKGNRESRDRSACKNSTVNRQLFPLDSNTTHVPVLDTSVYHEKHVRAVNIINAYARGYLTRRLMRTERVITLKKIYKEALHCMLKLHVDAPLNLAEVNFLHRLQLQCDAASLNLVELFAQPPSKRVKVIAQDREIKQSRMERPASARSYSFATQKTLARKNLKEFESTMIKYQRPLVVTKNIIRSRCQTWTSDIRERLVSPNTLNQSIRRSTSTGTVRKPWR